VCVCVVSDIQHATRMRHIAICGLSGSNTFSHIISQMAHFFKKSILNIKWVLIFSTSFT